MREKKYHTVGHPQVHNMEEFVSSCKKSFYASLIMYYVGTNADSIKVTSCFYDGLKYKCVLDYTTDEVSAHGYFIFDVLNGRMTKNMIFRDYRDEEVLYEKREQHSKKGL